MVYGLKRRTVQIEYEVAIFNDNCNLRAVYRRRIALGEQQITGENAMVLIRRLADCLNTAHTAVTFGLAT
jgi:hypothetical protein